MAPAPRATRSKVGLIRDCINIAIFDQRSVCSPPPPPSDAQYFAAAGADYLKEDSCCGSQDHETAFHQYGLMRDALNRTGRPIFFSLCGWNSWYAPVGASLGNSWRIHGDGSGWDHLSDATNTMAGIVQFSGPGGWNDPDLLIGPNVKVGGQTDLQSRSQFSLWAVMAAPLLISSNLLEASAYAIETWGNTEVIAVSQDPLAKPGFRIAGTNYSYPCSSTGGDYTVEVLPCITAADGSIDPSQAWFFNSSSGQMVFAGSTSTKGPLVLDNWQCGTVDRNPVTLFTPDHGTGTCQGKNQVNTHLHPHSHTHTHIVKPLIPTPPPTPPPLPPSPNCRCGSTLHPA